jgi:hypothetical protein
MQKIMPLISHRFFLGTDNGRTPASESPAKGSGTKVELCKSNRQGRPDSQYGSIKEEREKPVQ